MGQRLWHRQLGPFPAQTEVRLGLHCCTLFFGDCACQQTGSSFAQLPPPHAPSADLGRTLLPPAAQLDLSTASALTFLALTGFVASKVDLAMLSALRCLLLYECHLFEPPHGLGRLSALTRLVSTFGRLALQACWPDCYCSYCQHYQWHANFVMPGLAPAGPR